MSRRVVLLIALISLAILGAAAAPWTLSSTGLSSAVSEHLGERYGLQLNVEGRSTFAMLPTPRVKFENVKLTASNRAVSVDGGTLRGELRILPLILGRFEISEIALSDAAITASSQALQALNWADLLADRPHTRQARRLIIMSSSLHWTDFKEADLEKINLLVNWAGADQPLHAAGSAFWRNEPVTLDRASFHPALLAADRISPVSLTLSAPFGHLSLTGEALWGIDPRLSGETLIEATSVRDLTRWSRMDLPFGSLMQALAIKGDATLNRRRLTWPTVAVTLGTDKLEGTLAVRFDAERPVISGTLAAGDLNLSDFFRPLAQTRTSSGTWSDDAIDLSRTTGHDLDLRLSATAARLGLVRLDDMAASVLVRPGRIEASIGRASFHDGTLKGRLLLSSVNGVSEFKTQGTFDAVDVSTYLPAMGEPRWLTGRAQGQFQFEGTGTSPADVIRQSHGRTSITVKEGELVGLALNDALRRVEKRPLLASLNWKGGRTPFDLALFTLSVKDGIGEVSEARLSSPSLVTNLNGEISLIERTLNLKADVSAVTPAPAAAPAMVFDVNGGWDNVIVTPDARSLIQRSGAAKPLFGPNGLPQSEPLPLAVVQ
ncbi:AsmA family protein [Microvirga terricola]|uniref:AsmA family protein n=1 Tax=Microvirga terricola TaxID=2719797 RepID=A0ABX0VB78_9HYPH|nr:AsmA-like C-terminal region-containing protein [Microvirga terricola]NIX77109.1 hypothetical protein [Microvirga terricola]